MEEKKFKVIALSSFDSFKADDEYWVYSVKVEEDKIKFLMYCEADKKWVFSLSDNFKPIVEKSAQELLSEFQKLVK